MNDITKLTTGYTEKRGLFLILTKDRACQNKTSLIASLILKRSLFVLSGDEWLPAYELTRLIRSHTLNVRETLQRLYTVRASTCYRLLDSLANLPLNGEPVLVLEFLHTFYDSDIPLRVRLLKLRECCRQLRRLSIYRPITVMTQEMPTEDYEKFIPALYSITDMIFTLDPELEPIRQPSLF